ncbi:hypothetical protein L1987_58270 [Smallanthus sonchifolius]|uniref:Uncharacterized protein n=1 Tax=Smallanthus sonchifolius TaxID=185202 RepID=A0ACB9DER6_9ASTR|nr:hypothetical protein L1987_58270 [Smallanthus sonchifolius]
MGHSSHIARTSVTVNGPVQIMTKALKLSDCNEPIKPFISIDQVHSPNLLPPIVTTIKQVFSICVSTQRNKVTFFVAAKVSSSFPSPYLPENAFVDRSNVVKSSLLNSLTTQCGAVRTATGSLVSAESTSGSFSVFSPIIVCTITNFKVDPSATLDPEVKEFLLILVDDFMVECSMVILSI